MQFHPFLLPISNGERHVMILDSRLLVSLCAFCRDCILKAKCLKATGHDSQSNSPRQRHMFPETVVF
eukprot:5383000-Amphidinium_carterae.1